MHHARDVTPEFIADQILAGLARLLQAGKDLANGWDVSEVSLVDIRGGSYNPSYTHGGPETFQDTAYRMCRTDSGGIDRQALQNVIAGIRLAVERPEFTADSRISVCKVFLLINAQQLQERLIPLA